MAAMKKTIAIVTGGDSSEIVISLRSAQQVRDILEGEYNTYIVSITRNDWHVALEEDMKVRVDRNDFSFRYRGSHVRFDYAFLAMHGPPGEDGTLQAYFDLLGIPYSSSGVLSLALSFNKYRCKSYLSHFNIPTARAVLLDRREEVGTEEIIGRIGLPCIIKPNCGGSSFGVTKINDREQLTGALHKAWEEDTRVIIEEFIEGREFTCGLLKLGEREMIFPLTEIISKNEFFDYQAKYTKGFAKEITPAPVSEEQANRCRRLASEIYELLECRGIVRIDFISSGDEFYFLELNGIPGMTRESVIPLQIRAHGLTEREVYGMIIEESFKS
jgi:D-alanine-D-alanine ligase